MTEQAPAYGDNAYISSSQQTLLYVLDVLGDQPLTPIGVKSIVERLNIKRDSVFRALKNLEAGGWAEQTPDGNWRLTPRLTRLSEKVRVAIAHLHHTYLEGRP